MIKKLLTIAALIFMTMSCSSPTLRENTTQKERTLYDQGVRSLSQGNYKMSYEMFTKFLSQYPTTPMLSGALYNLGLSLEGLGRYGEAAEKYQKVAEFHQNAHSRDEIDALYRLSLCYEVLGQDDKNIVTLLQIEKNRQYLSRETSETELYARLAGAYARLGHLDSAEKYYTKAEVGLKKMRRLNVAGDTKLWLPKTLYSMGHVIHPDSGNKEKDFQIFMTTLSRGQTWLLRSAELGDPVWSKLAQKDLEALYQRAWDDIEKFPEAKDKDKLLAMKKNQEKARALAGELDDTIEKLKLERYPMARGQNEAPEVIAIFKKVADVRAHVDATIKSWDVQDQDTPESQELQALKRKGHIKDLGNEADALLPKAAASAIPVGTPQADTTTPAGEGVIDSSKVIIKQ